MYRSMPEDRRPLLACDDRRCLPLRTVWSVSFVSLLLLLASVAVIVAALASCRVYRPACQPEALARIEAAYVAETTAACKGYDLETCPSIGAIETKYAAMREEWARCQ